MKTLKIVGTALCLDLLCAIGALAETGYVDMGSPNPTYPYTNWTTAAHAIELVVGIGSLSTVLVANGVYSPAQSIDTYNVTLQSLNGRDFTTIDGTNHVDRYFCVYLNHTNAVVDGFTLRNGVEHGAMVFAGTLRNCILENNGSTNATGAGAYLYGAQSRIINCIVRSNSAYSGGGLYVYEGFVSNCQIYANRARGYDAGGGAFLWGDTCSIV